MAFEKGNRHGKGRPPGSENKLSHPVRETLKRIVEGELPKLQRNLKAIEKKSKVQHAELVLKLIEYILPKLSRLEMKDVNGFDELAAMPKDQRRERMRELAKQILNDGKETTG